DLRLVEGQRRMQIGEIVLESLVIQASRADVRCARRVGGDRHAGTPKARKSGASSFLTAWSIVSPGAASVKPWFGFRTCEDSPQRESDQEQLYSSLSAKEHCG